MGCSGAVRGSMDRISGWVHGSVSGSCACLLAFWVCKSEFVGICLFAFLVVCGFDVLVLTTVTFVL